MARDKVRIRFRKGGTLRLISHHDLMRCFERMLRRADLPFHSTQGYNPKPRLVFALSLGLGIRGCAEVVDLELDEPLPAEEIHQRLARQAPDGLEIISVRRVDPKSGAHVRRVCYRLAVPPARQPDLGERIASILNAPNCWVERTRPQPRRVDLHPYLRDLHVRADALEMDLWVTPTGTARPEEILRLLGLADLLETGAVLERTMLELHDEGDGPAPGRGEEVLAAAGAAALASPPHSPDGAGIQPVDPLAPPPFRDTQPKGNT
jgi:radical SAM-linked protein